MLLRITATLACAAPLLAQVTTPRTVDRPAPNFAGPSSPGYRGTIEVGGAFVPESSLRLGSADLGDVQTRQHRIRYTGTFNGGGPVNWSIGAEYEQFTFDFDQSTLLPDRVGSATLPLGVTWRISDRWTFLGEVSPGVYSDFEDLGGSDFNAPVIAGLSYAVNDNLLLFLQVSVDPRRDIPVVGGPGLRWQINRQWALSLLLPRPRVEFRPADRWLLYAGGEMVGGAFQLADDHGSERGRPDLDNVNMTYREIRGGIGAIWDIAGGFRLEGAVGWAFDRRFVVADRDLQWNGDGAPYARLQFSYRY